IAWVALLIVILLGLAKLHLRFGWMLTRDQREKAWRMYISMMSVLCDLGIRRARGETRSEFRSRVAETIACDPLHTGFMVNIAKYHPQASLSLEQLSAARATDISELRKIPFIKRALAFFNPSSVFSQVGASW
ncbi:MAG: hypothetical protein KDD53_08400, partial [Bdellovibrionales bacterium]|nr:hypothetical protein [Bdellovibrionales bacterium]